MSENNNSFTRPTRRQALMMLGAAGLATVATPVSLVAKRWRKKPEKDR